MDFCNLNGVLYSKDDYLIRAANRSFSYGDGVFETIRMFDGHLPFLADHINRLQGGMAYLNFDIPEAFTTSFLEQEIRKIGFGNAVIRLTVFREDGGLYTPTDNTPSFLITTREIDQSNFSLNEEGLSIGLFEDEHLACTPLSNFKTCNALPYILASQYCQEQELGDCLLKNEHGNLAEATSANLFIVNNKRVYTPSLLEGCIDGVLRKQVIKILQDNGQSIIEKSVTISDLHEADEVWLTNSVKGIRWVKSFQDTTYKDTMVQEILVQLNKMVTFSQT